MSAASTNSKAKQSQVSSVQKNWKYATQKFDLTAHSSLSFSKILSTSYHSASITLISLRARKSQIYEVTTFKRINFQSLDPSSSKVVSVEDGGRLV